MDSHENNDDHMNGEETAPQNDTADTNGAGAEAKAAADEGGQDFPLSKGNEDKKIFVGGIAYDVTNEDLSSYFSQFGEVAQVQVKYDRATGRSRGFAFVEFGTNEACKAALVNREQTIKNKKVEVKPAKSRENKKVFVGGLPSDFPEADLRKHFEEFGKVEDIEWPFDKQRNARRNFAFIVFEEEEAADRASALPKQTFGDRECDVKKAVPQGKRFAQSMIGGGRGGMFGNYRGGYGRGGGGFYGNNIWGGTGAMANYGGYGGGWGDWYANAGNFYGSGTNATGYGSYGGGGYYDDYSSGGYGDYWGGSGAGYDSYSQAQATSGGAAGGHRGGGSGGNRYTQQHHQQY